MRFKGGTRARSTCKVAQPVCVTIDMSVIEQLSPPASAYLLALWPLGGLEDAQTCRKKHDSW